MRKDLRTGAQSREFSVTLGGVVEADGAARVSQGETLVIATVSGPAQPRFSRHEVFDKLTIDVSVNFASKSMEATRTLCNESRAVKFIKQVLEASVLLENFPRLLLSINVLIVRNEGSALSAAVNACTLALLDAGIPMKAYAACVEIAVLKNELFIDPTIEEEGIAEGNLIAAFSSAKDNDGMMKVYSMESMGMISDIMHSLHQAHIYASFLSNTIRTAINEKTAT